MPLQTDISFPKEDVSALFRQLKRSEKELGYTMQQSMTFALKLIVRSLAASTRNTKEKERPVRQVASDINKRRLQVFEVTGYYRNGRSKRGPKKLETKTVRAKSIENARRYHAAIPFRGLAKKSWSSAAKAARIAIAVSSGRRPPRLSKRIDYLAAKYGTYNGNLKSKTDPWFRITNTLSYARSAFKGKGKMLPETSLARAGRGMEKAITKKLEKIGAKK